MNSGELSSAINVSLKDPIACYAAIISTIALLWNIIDAILEKLPRLKVRIIPIWSAPVIHGVGIVGPPKNMLTTEVTNISSI